MTITPSCLIETSAAPTAETTGYTATSKKTIIDKYSGYCAAGSGSLTLKLVPSGLSAGAAHILAAKSFAAGETYTFPEVVGHILNPGDFISEIATGIVVRRASGREVT
jgi:hypothetical protein